MPVSAPPFLGDRINLADHGVRYNDSSARTLNRGIIETILHRVRQNLIVGGQIDGVGIYLGGFRLAPRLPVHGRLHVDLSAGPILIPETESGGNRYSWHFFLDGTGSTLVGHGGTPTTPLLKGTCHIQTHVNFEAVVWELRNLVIRCHAASGIELIGCGKSTRMYNINVNTAGAGVMNAEHPDNDFETAGFGVKLKDWDGGLIEDLYTLRCGGHGVILDRVHTGRMDITSRENEGNGVHARKLKGDVVDLYCESNRGWGFYIDQAYRSRLTSVWCENNRHHGHEGSFGIRHRQYRIRRSFQCNFEGYTSEDAGQFQSDGGSMVACNFNGHPAMELGEPIASINNGGRELTDAMWNPTGNQDNDGDGIPDCWNGHNNFATRWSNLADAPSISLDVTDGGITIDYPAATWKNAIVGPGNPNHFWYPLRLLTQSLPTPDADDLIHYSLTFRVDEAFQSIVDWSKNREPANLPHHLFRVRVGDWGVPDVPVGQQGFHNVGVYRTGIDQTVNGWLFLTGQPTKFPSLDIGMVSAGLDQGDSNPAFTIRILDIRIWHVPR